tara:strand:+ start:209 stop:880 length:672 start_codon:yes stop_codon:yes gene_type:complete
MKNNNNSNKGNNSKRNNKTSSKNDAMSGLCNILMILLIVLVIIYVVKEYQKDKRQKEEGFQGMNSEGAMSDQIENFIIYPNQQKFCPNLYNSASSFWTTLPKEYGNGLMCKFCCTSCYYRVSKEIICGKNKTGEYKICTLKQKDIKNLEQYYKNNFKNKNNFPFNKNKLNTLQNSKVLKMKKNNIYYPIQVLKTKEQLQAHEKEPTIADQLYKKSNSYKCSKK